MEDYERLSKRDLAETARKALAERDALRAKIAALVEALKAGHSDLRARLIQYAQGSFGATYDEAVKYTDTAVPVLVQMKAAILTVQRVRSGGKERRMKKIIEKESGATIYPDLFTFGNLDWNVLVREGGTVSIYGTKPDWAVNAVAIDDCAPVVWADGTAEELEAKFRLMAEVASTALAAIERVKESEAANG